MFVYLFVIVLMLEVPQPGNYFLVILYIQKYKSTKYEV